MLAGLTLAATSCVTYTPMSPSEVEQLTTCQASLDQVRRNLLLAGYGLDHVTDEEIITDFKQTHGRTWQRITVVKDSEDQVRFRIRKRTESIRELPSETHTTTMTSTTSRGNLEEMTEAQRQLRSATVRSETVYNDRDISYYQESRGDHARTKYEVCGHY